MDNLTKIQRSYNMSRIRSSKTKPELKLKKLMKKLNFSYQPKICGKPDFANKAEKIVIFVDGCFWHKCSTHFVKPRSNKKYWYAKIKKNVSRDKKINAIYTKSGWKVVRIWEHDLI
jgi:DNA mismatch endonuclease (patch repair protein)